MQIELRVLVALRASRENGAMSHDRFFTWRDLSGQP
jgi:hypothetical protein